MLGAGGWTTFWRVTLPAIRWGLLYGLILCNARAMGEFGAVSVVSGHIRGETNTLPLHAEILYNEYDFTGATRGKFYREDAVLVPPVHLELDVLEALQARARARGTTARRYTSRAWTWSKSACLRFFTPESDSSTCPSAITPAWPRHAAAQASTQPSRARIGRPLCAVWTRPLTPPPTPAMHDISARPSRSSHSAIWLAICAALEQPEQE